MQENVVILTFAEESKAYQALSELKAAAAQTRLKLVNAVVIDRDAATGFRARDGFSDGAPAEGPLIGTLLGSLIGIFGGPLGVLLGGASGALLGSAVSSSQAVDRASLIDQMLSAVPVGSTAVVATVGEFADEVLDGLAAKLGGVVLRRPAAAVMAEVESLREAEDAAAREARRVLREQRKDEWSAKYESWKDEVQDKWEALKLKLKK
ncbi:MAG: DUF1269 domain-containing protein [Proteobacteria bacterium]|nr:DUF1269 domain-containing protein [Pseudomonadota bacterium]